MEQTSGSGAGLPLLVQRTIAKQVNIMIMNHDYDDLDHDHDDDFPQILCFFFSLSKFIFAGSNEEEDWSGQVKLTQSSRNVT